MSENSRKSLFRKSFIDSSNAPRMLDEHEEDEDGEEEEENTCHWEWTTDEEAEACYAPYPNCYADDFPLTVGTCDGYTPFDEYCYPCDDYEYYPIDLYF